MGIPVKVRVTMLSSEGVSVGDLLDFACSYYRDRGLKFSCRILNVDGKEKSLIFSMKHGSSSLLEACSGHPIFEERCRCRTKGGIELVFDDDSGFYKSLVIPFEVEFTSGSAANFVSMVRKFPAPHFDYYTSRVARPSCVGIWNSDDFEDQSEKGQKFYRKEGNRLAEVFSDVKHFFLNCDHVCVAAFHGDQDRDDYPNGQNRVNGIPYNTIVLEKNGIPSRLLVELECPAEIAEGFVKFDRQGVNRPFFLSSWEYFSTEVREKKVRDFLKKVNGEIQKLKPGFREIRYKDVSFSNEEIAVALREGYRKYWPSLF